MATNPDNPNPEPNPTDPFAGVNFDELSKRLGGYTSSLGDIAEQAKKALAGLPLLSVKEKRKVQINGHAASVSLIEPAGILIEFTDSAAAAEHFKNQYQYP